MCEWVNNLPVQVQRTDWIINIWVVDSLHAIPPEPHRRLPGPFCRSCSFDRDLAQEPHWLKIRTGGHWTNCCIEDDTSHSLHIQQSSFALTLIQPHCHKDCFNARKLYNSSVYDRWTHLSGIRFHTHMSVLYLAVAVVLRSIVYILVMQFALLSQSYFYSALSNFIFTFLSFLISVAHVHFCTNNIRPQYWQFHLFIHLPCRCTLKCHCCVTVYRIYVLLC